jgi:hypothetical protein
MVESDDPIGYVGVGEGGGSDERREKEEGKRKEVAT